MRWRVGQPVALSQEDRDVARFDVLPADSLSACRRWHRGRKKDEPPSDSLGCSPRPPPSPQADARRPART